MTALLGIVVLSFLGVSPDGQPAGLVAHWPLDEGSGDRVCEAVAKTEGIVHGAEWTACGPGYALAFGREGSYVDCGGPPQIDLTGPLSLEAWVYAEKIPSSETGVAGKSFESYAFTAYGDGRFYWYVGSGGNKCSAPAPVRKWTHLIGTFDGTSLKLYVNGKLQESRPSQFKETNHDGHFYLGCIARGANSANLTDSFPGQIGAVRVYNRALTEDEAMFLHSRERVAYRTPANASEGLRVKAFPYFGEQRVMVDVDFGTLAPFAEGDRAEIVLRKPDGTEPVKTASLSAIPESGMIQDVTIDMAGQSAGEYGVQATFLGTDGLKVQGSAKVIYGPPKDLPSPREHAVAAPPAPLDPVEYEFEVTESGGIQISLNGMVYPVESTFSFPKGGENGLTCRRLESCEAQWNVNVDRHGKKRVSVRAEGISYRLERAIERDRDHVTIRDTFTNLLNEPLGILISNHVDLRGIEGIEVTKLPNPSLFLAKAGQGIGLVALDDVYLEHYETFHDAGFGGIRDHKFALDAGASYTLEWAVYVNRGDYYDFINAVRRDEGLIRTVEGGFAFVDRRKPPTEDFVHLRGLKYASIGCLSNAADDAGVSIEGVEFMEYPKECALIKETFDATKAQFPGLKVMFHVAHSLFATAKPNDLFPDSRTINAKGSQTDYGDNNISYYMNYFSKERVDEGYRWFIFYPTKTNAFGAYMASAVNYMLDTMGATGMFADGLTHGYGGRFTYDRWDGHTAEIDPVTKTITRKHASVNLLAQDALLDIIRAIEARGGVVIANSDPGTRTLHRENVLYCVETGGGDKTCTDLYLAPTVISLGNPGRIHGERDVYDDIRAKIEYGSLYFFYGEGTLTRPTLASRMYPITVEEFRPGLIRGRERLITTRSGVHAWPGDGTIPFVIRYDARGVVVEHSFPTTVDREGTRTELGLGEGESAILERVPVSVASKEPVNVSIAEYSPDAMEILMSGQGTAEIRMEDGPFCITKGTQYTVEVDGAGDKVNVSAPTLSFTVNVDGLRKVRVSPVK